jgi:hypothetical protein
LTLDAGRFTSVDYDTQHKNIRLHLAEDADGSSVAKLRFTQTTPMDFHYKLAKRYDIQTGAYVIPRQTGKETTVVLENASL